MAYIGQGIKEGTFSVLDTSGNTYNGSNVTFNLGTQVGSPAQLLVSHDGVIQKPGTDYSLATGGTQITFSTAPASGASIFIVEISGAVGGPLDSDLNGTELILDADGDTSITADTDDQIDIKIAGADDFQFTANQFLVQTGSKIDINGTELVLDADADTSITADTDDQIDVRIAGADDFQFTANTFTAQSGSTITTPTLGVIGAHDLGAGIHIKTADSGASVSSEADELVIEHGNAIGGMSLLAATDGVSKIAFGDSGDNDIGMLSYSHDANKMMFHVNAAERINIDSSGRVNINTASAITGEGVLQVSSNSSQNLSAWRVATNGNVGLRFFNSSTQGVGDITINASGTAFNTSSDYRLKENESLISDGITRLKTLKPYRFNFKTEPDTTVDGFFAHEVSSIVPEAITGTKDATETYTDDNGDEQTKIKPQSIDQSKLVPLLTAALKESITKIEALEARVTTLEG